MRCPRAHRCPGGAAEPCKLRGGKRIIRTRGGKWILDKCEGVLRKGGVEGGVCWRIRKIVPKSHRSTGASRETGSCRKSRKVSSIGSRSQRTYPHGSSSLKQKEEMTKEDEAPGKERN